MSSEMTVAQKFERIEVNYSRAKLFTKHAGINFNAYTLLSYSMQYYHLDGGMSQFISELMSLVLEGLVPNELAQMFERYGDADPVSKRNREPVSTV